MGMDPPRTCRTVGADDLLRANMSIKEVTVSLDAGKTGGKMQESQFFRKDGPPKGVYYSECWFQIFFMFTPIWGRLG